MAVERKEFKSVARDRALVLWCFGSSEDVGAGLAYSEDVVGRFEFPEDTVGCVESWTDMAARLDSMEAVIG